MMGTRRIAVIGLYNSGSTALAGMLHRLRVNMGPPFWANSDDDSEENFYEPLDLSLELRKWWRQPKLLETAPATDRIRFLKTWIAAQESARPGPVGAKHPLLSLCVGDLRAAWGTDTCLLWVWRPLEESVAGLLRRAWFREGTAVEMQQRLWDTLNGLENSEYRLIRLEWNQVKSNPDWGARELARLTRLEPSEEQLRAAGGFVRSSAGAK